MPGAQIALLPDGRRLHLNHGPIDLIVEAVSIRVRNSRIGLTGIN